MNNTNIEDKKMWRMLYAIICTILNMRISYLRGELPIPSEDGLFLQIFGYFIVYPFFIITAWFWGNKSVYKKMVVEVSSNPISYKAWLNIGTTFFFLFMLFFIVITFIFPVSTEYHYGR